MKSFPKSLTGSVAVLSVVAVLSSLATFTGCGSAAAKPKDAMMQDSMKSDGMMKDGMKSDGMMKDGMKGDGMMKDGMKGDSMMKDGAASGGDMKSDKKM